MNSQKLKSFWNFVTLFKVWSYHDAKVAAKALLFIKSSVTNSDAFAELCNEIQEVYKANTCSLHPGTNS